MAENEFLWLRNVLLRTNLVAQRFEFRIPIDLHARCAQLVGLICKSLEVLRRWSVRPAYRAGKQTNRPPSLSVASALNLWALDAFAPSACSVGHRRRRHGAIGCCECSDTRFDDPSLMPVSLPLAHETLPDRSEDPDQRGN
jgi:hypothetical protein